MRDDRLTKDPNLLGSVQKPRWVDMSVAMPLRILGTTQPVPLRKLTQHLSATFEISKAISDADSPPPTTTTRFPSNGSEFL